jgi:hypothetical protein
MVIGNNTSAGSTGTEAGHSVITVNYVIIPLLVAGDPTPFFCSCSKSRRSDSIFLQLQQVAPLRQHFSAVAASRAAQTAFFCSCSKSRRSDSNQHVLYVLQLLIYVVILNAMFLC